MVGSGRTLRAVLSNHVCLTGFFAMFIWIVIGLCAVIFLSLGWDYNTLISPRQRCRQAFGDIDVQLRQRHDLVPNLLRSVKAYMATSAIHFRQ